MALLIKGRGTVQAEGSRTSAVDFPVFIASDKPKRRRRLRGPGPRVGGRLAAGRGAGVTGGAGEVAGSRAGVAGWRVGQCVGQAEKRQRRREWSEARGGGRARVCHRAGPRGGRVGRV
ncbi:hypothetical protein GCM10027440_31330 [Nocardiopsis coralliicola]